MRYRKLIINILFYLAVILIFGACKNKEVVALFTVEQDTVETGDTVYFTNLSENANYYQWDFGDGEKSFDQDPYHVYTEKGTYEVVLTAIGDGNSDQTSDTITVELNYDVTIYEGKGIEGISVYDPWSKVQSLYANYDTVHYIEYLTDYGFYYQIVDYYQIGVAFSFLTSTPALSSDEPVFTIFIFYPYIGATAKGILIGSTMTEVTEAYGTPEISSGSNYTGYWYSDVGIDFYTYESGVVDEIDIYEASSSSSSTTEKSAVIQSINKKFRAEGFFRRR